jgi:toxin YoeB
MPSDRLLIFQPVFLNDLRWWVQTDRKLALRVLSLVDAISRDPFEGIGKPEPLRYLGPQVWSRRINDEHRLVYIVRAEQLVFIEARYHYGE